jgi:hypothetical protein
MRSPLGTLRYGRLVAIVFLATGVDGPRPARSSRSRIYRLGVP